MLLPVSGVVPSMVRTISNVSVNRSLGDTSQSGEFSSILIKNQGFQAVWKEMCMTKDEGGQMTCERGWRWANDLWDRTIGQKSWKKSCVPSRSVPNSMACRWYGISCKRKKDRTSSDKKLQTKVSTIRKFRFEPLCIKNWIWLFNFQHRSKLDGQMDERWQEAYLLYCTKCQTSFRK